jgi:hypothetical protein
MTVLNSHSNALKGLKIRSACYGLSLLEISLAMLVISVALAPVVKMIGGANSSNGNAGQVTAQKSKEAVIAGTIIDKVLSQDYSGFDCDGAGNPIVFNPAVHLPVGTTAANSVRRYNLCKVAGTNADLYYQWTAVHVNASNSLNNLPTQNQYYQASLSVIGPDRNANNPLFVIPINFFYNAGSFTPPQNETGVMFALDVSGSMGWLNTDGTPTISASSGKELAPPFLFYRYDRNLYTGNAWGGGAFNPAQVPSVLNRWNNQSLDLALGQTIGVNPDASDPDPDTPQNEKFPYGNVNLLGSGNCSSSSNGVWMGSDNFLKHFAVWDARRDTTYRSYIQNLCKPKATQVIWENMLNQNMSRLEAARTAALSLLISLESNPQISSRVSIGFVPWSNVPQVSHLVTPERTQAVPGNSGVFYKLLRENLLWINRADPSSVNSGLPILAGGGTNIRKGLEVAASSLQAGFDRRIIILLTDGEPSPNSGNNSKTALRDYTLNTIGKNAPGNQQVTLFSVGLIAADGTLLTDMSNNTQDGQAFVASSVASLKPIFESISYQIQKLALLSISDRYNIDLT